MFFFNWDYYPLLELVLSTSWIEEAMAQILKHIQ